MKEQENVFFSSFFYVMMMTAAISMITPSPTQNGQCPILIMPCKRPSGRPE